MCCKARTAAEEAPNATKLKEENPAQAALLKQDSAMARAEARISQRHRARSKWVKKALALGGTGVAAAACKAELNEHLARAQVLQAKINTRPSAKPGSAAQRDDSDDSDEDSEGGAATDWELAAEGDEATGRRDMRDLRRARENLAAELAEVDAAAGAAAASGSSGAPAKGLAGMKFMPIAANTSRAAAAEALAQVEAELAAEERHTAERRRRGEAAGDTSDDSDDADTPSTHADPNVLLAKSP
jgi:U3 small nucleolar RNA-associated protein 14